MPELSVNDHQPGNAMGLVNSGAVGTVQRDRYFGGDRKEQVWDRVQAVTKDLGVPLERLPAIALRYCLSHPAVSTIIPRDAFCAQRGRQCP